MILGSIPYYIFILNFHFLRFSMILGFILLKNIRGVNLFLYPPDPADNKRDQDLPDGLNNVRNMGVVNKSQQS